MNIEDFEQKEYPSRVESSVYFVFKRDQVIGSYLTADAFRDLVSRLGISNEGGIYRIRQRMEEEGYTVVREEQSELYEQKVKEWEAEDRIRQARFEEALNKEHGVADHPRIEEFWDAVKQAADGEDVQEQKVIFDLFVRFLKCPAI